MWKKVSDQGDVVKKQKTHSWAKFITFLNRLAKIKMSALVRLI